MRLYYAVFKGTGDRLTFNDEVLYVSNPDVLPFLLKGVGEKKVQMEDLEIRETEWEKVHDC